MEMKPYKKANFLPKKITMNAGGKEKKRTNKLSKINKTRRQEKKEKLKQSTKTKQ